MISPKLTYRGWDPPWGYVGVSWRHLRYWLFHTWKFERIAGHRVRILGFEWDIWEAL
jgi:hypothetical protein